MVLSYRDLGFRKLIWKGKVIINKLLLLILVQQLCFVSLRELKFDFVI